MLWRLVSPRLIDGGGERPKDVMRVVATIVNDLSIERDVLGFANREDGPFDIVGKVAHEKGEVLACEATGSRA